MKSMKGARIVLSLFALVLAFASWGELPEANTIALSASTFASHSNSIPSLNTPGTKEVTKTETLLSQPIENDISVQEISDAEIIARVVGTLRNAEHLSLCSTQELTFTETLPGSGEASVSQITVTFDIDMIPDWFELRAWNDSNVRPTTKLFFVSDPAPTYTESHWYPVANRYRDQSYPSPPRGDIGKLMTETHLYAGLGIPACAMGEFLGTWIGPDSWRAERLCRMLGMSRRVGTEDFNGRTAYHFIRDSGCSPGKKPGQIQCTVAHYWVDTETFYFIGWTSENSDDVQGSYESSFDVRRKYEWHEHHR